MSKIAILGAGSWGTALAMVLSRTYHPQEVSLWARDAALAEILKRHRENSTYLPGIVLPVEVRVTSDLRAAVGAAEIVIGAMPSAHARSIYSLAAVELPPKTVVISATKGLEPTTHLRMSRVIAQVFEGPGRADFSRRLAVLSGPSFAADAARGEPTAIVLASEDDSLADQLQEELAGPSFRVYTNADVLGVEIAGAMKNVIAIAAGACQGLGFGANAQAALVTRGLAEMNRLSTALGGRAETLFGLAGLGDLVLTCTGAQSRNRHVGVELGKGRSLQEILASMRMVAEGVGTTAALLALSRKHHVELPITEQVDAILHGGKAPRDAIRDIMDRPQKREHTRAG
jgi:glycerol-3-phosphate dehydrogenase (NAD(P)+)